MDNEQIQKRKNEFINALNSKLTTEYPHIKLDDVKLDAVTGTLKISIMQTPRGVQITEEIHENTIKQIQDLLNTANYNIKKMAVEDVIKWCIEEHEPVNLNGINIIFDSTVPTDTIIMNHATYLEFRRYRPPL